MADLMAPDSISFTPVSSALAKVRLATCALVLAALAAGIAVAALNNSGGRTTSSTIAGGTSMAETIGRKPIPIPNPSNTSGEATPTFGANWVQTATSSSATTPINKVSTVTRYWDEAASGSAQTRPKRRRSWPQRPWWIRR